MATFHLVMHPCWAISHVAADTGAVSDIFSEHKYTKSKEASVCAAIKDGGCDIDSGRVYHDHLLSAVSEGFVHCCKFFVTP